VKEDKREKWVRRHEVEQDALRLRLRYVRRLDIQFDHLGKLVYGWTELLSELCRGAKLELIRISVSPHPNANGYHTRKRAPPYIDLQAAGKVDLVLDGPCWQCCSRYQVEAQVRNLTIIGNFYPHYHYSSSAQARQLPLVIPSPERVTIAVRMEWQWYGHYPVPRPIANSLFFFLAGKGAVCTAVIEPASSSGVTPMDHVPVVWAAMLKYMDGCRVVRDAPAPQPPTLPEGSALVPLKDYKFTRGDAYELEGLV
jgi:hypothetical protein